MMSYLLDAVVTYEEKAETVCLEFASELEVGGATLTISYTGILNDQMRGFYRSKYSHPDNPKEERYAATTQFEVRWRQGGERAEGRGGERGGRERGEGLREGGRERGEGRRRDSVVRSE